MNNLGRWVALLELALNGIFLLVAPIFFGLSGYKIFYFSQIGRSTGGGIIGSLLSVLVTGCPACSITLASYIGLGSVLSVFPYFGYEIRVLGIAILLYATYRVYHSLETCEFRQISTK